MSAPPVSPAGTAAAAPAAPGVIPVTGIPDPGIPAPSVDPNRGSLTGMTRTVRAPALGRLDSIDLVRGIVMVIMLLDHTRDFTHASGFLYDPTDLTRTTPWLFATRWITHLCAPAFVFLAGTSTGVQLLRGASPRDIARFLLTRGLWLMFLELTLVRLVTWWNVGPEMLALTQVIWVIGLSMVVISALVRLPLRVIGTLGVAVVLGHNLLDAIQLPGFQGPGAPMPTLAAKLWMMFHQTGLFPVGDSFPGPMVLAMYPLLPWLGIMMAGVGFAELYGMDRARRVRTILLTAGAMLAAFLVLRGFNVYGDPRPWTAGATAALSIMSFMNLQKYGPSLLFTLATLLPSFLLLAWYDGRTPGPVGRVLVTFGRVPMFFYIGQWISAHLFGMVVALAYGRTLQPFFSNPMSMPNMTEFGGPLWLTYVCWALGAIALYFPCRWYAGIKARRKDLVLLRYF